MVTRMHSSMLEDAQLLWGFRSSPQSCSAELTVPITELWEPPVFHSSLWKLAKGGRHSCWASSARNSSLATQLPAGKEGICLALAPNLFPLLLASSTWAPCGTGWAVHGSITTCRARPWAPHPAAASKDRMGPSLQGSSLFTLTAQQHFPHKPGMKMAEGESGRL